MPDGQVLEFSGVTKRFGSVTAVSDFSARVEPGVVTGFLGPNGAGKTTSLRILLGLVRATNGTATIGGVPYSKLRQPLQTVGAVLEASSFHPGRTAANHLKVYAQAAGLPLSRVDETLATVGLTEVAGRKVGGYSLGMRQRLGLAYALLGDPGVLVLDEPANGLDPEGIKWMRGLLRQLARQGRTVLVSSHLLAEVQQTVDALLIISQGRLVFQGGLDALTDPSEYVTVVDSPDRAELTTALREAGLEYEVLRSGLTVRGGDTLDVGRIAAASGVALSTLQRRGPGLEEVFLDLVNGVRVHESAGVPLAGVPVAPPVEDGAEQTEAVAEAAELPTETAEGEEIIAEDRAIAEEEPAEAVTEPEEEADAADAAAPHAAFAVASTGIIEVIPDATPDAEEPAEPSETPAEAPEPEQEQHVWAMPAAAPHDEPAEDAPAQDAPEAPADEASADDDIPEPADDTWPPEAPRTEADIEADRFFSAFDDGSGSDAAEHTADGDVQNDGGEEEASDSSADTGTEHEGGEQR